MPTVLNVLMAHQGAAYIAQLLERWKDVTDPGNLLLAHGGSEADFREVAHPQKVFIPDRRLRTRDHQREMQSITGVFHAARDWMQTSQRSYDFIYFSEFDHLPLVPDLNARQIKRLSDERADVIGFHLQRIDGTSDPHYLYHLSNPNFRPFFRALTKREDADVALGMMGTGSFWKRNAFESVAAIDEPFPIYQEVYVPTLAHHLGYRLRDWAEQNRFVLNKGDRGGELSEAVRAGAWTLHPVKTLPEKTR